MYNYKITRIAYFPLCFIVFCSIVIFCELIGLGFAAIERDAMNVVSGAFFGVALGFSGVALAAVFIFIFNLFTSVTGGLPVRIDARETPAAPEDAPPSQM